MRSDGLARPEPLTVRNDVAGFDCGVPALDLFLKRDGLQNQAGGGARTYVASRRDRAVAYYSLAPASVAVAETPARVSKAQARHDIPVVLLARLAVDRSEQGRGLGKAMLRDALLRAVQGAGIIGGRALLVHAKNEVARGFYLRFDFEPSPTDPLHLCLLMKDLRKTLLTSG